MQMKKACIYYKNICTCIMKMKKTCIMKTLHQMMQMKKMYYKNIALDDVDEKTCIKKTAHLKMKMKKNSIVKNIALDDVGERKTCIIKTLNLIMQMKNVL